MAIVLAGGASRRFGRRDKLRAMLGGRPLLAHAIGRARASGSGRVIVVARRTAGLGESLRAALGRVRPIERELLLFLGDMPLAAAPRGLRLRPGRDAARPAVGGRPGHPVLVRTTVARGALRPGDRGLALDPARLGLVRGTAGNALDVDTVAALARLRRRIAGAGGALRLLNR